MINAPSPDLPRLSGCASLAGTEHYAERFFELDPGHFRLCHGLVVSSLGIGTYLGDATDEVDAAYLDCLLLALVSGCNVIDTAINYRFQRSERVIGRALQLAVKHGFSREEIVVSSKAGFIPFELNFPADPYQWMEDHLFRAGIITPDDVHPSGHCMTPMYLWHQLEQSLANLQLDKLDIFYLHNPETQMSDLNESRFYEAIEMAFRALETAVYDGRIAMYGIATWDGFYDEGGGRLMQLERLVDAARRVGGDQHHFRMIQLPINLEMTDALSAPNQKVGDRQMTLLEAACSLNVCVVGSAALLQQNLVDRLPVTMQQAIPDMPSDAARALQFARSVPDVTTALVGMSTTAHVTENMELAGMAPLSAAEFNMLFGER